MKKRWSLSGILSLLFVGSFVVTVSVFYGTLVFQTRKSMEEQEKTLLKETSQMLAKNEDVKEALVRQEAPVSLQEMVDDLTKLNHLDFIVLMDMNSIRLTHPDKNQIGKTFQGGDQTPAINGKENLSTSKGTLGESLRYFVPVFKNEKQVGVVAAGIKLTSISSIIQSSQHYYTVALIICLIFGGFLTFFVTVYLKRQLHNLEPQEIFRILEERNAMLEQTKDPVYVIDLNEKIQLTNIAGKELTQHKEALEGKKLEGVLINRSFIDFKKKTEQIYRQSGKDYLVSVSPIMVKQKRIGSIIFLRNVTESLFVLEQLASTTTYASALQSQSHEFMNKLHVIYGLVDLEEYEELKIYLESILRPQQEILNRFSLLIKEPVIAGFFIGDREKFSEKKTNMDIDVQSEIPQSVEKERLDLLINLYRFIHMALLEKSLPDTLQVELLYENGELKTTYKLPKNDRLQKKLQSIFHDFYFQQLLEDRKASFSIGERNGLIEIILKAPYGGQQ